MNETETREQLMNEIVELERRMFVAVKAEEPSACQSRLNTFAVMRRMAHSVLSAATLRSYRADLEAAFEQPKDTSCCVAPNLSNLCPPPSQAGEMKRNFFTEKYARVQGLIPPLKQNPLIEEILACELHWAAELREEFPRLLGPGDALERYEHAELETYSDETLEMLVLDVRAAAKAGRNLVRERYQYLAESLGVPSIAALMNSATK